MTTCNVDIDLDREVFADFFDIAGRRVVPLIWVNLIVDEMGNFNRLVSADRNQGITKLMNVDILVDVLSNYQLLTPEISEQEREGVEYRFLSLDTRQWSVEPSVIVVLEFIEGALGGCN